MTSCSQEMLAAVVRGFWKCLSNTNTSGSNGELMHDCEIKFGYTGKLELPSGQGGLNELLRKIVWPRLPFVDRVEARESPGTRP